jgi:hypothetical protein
MTTYCTQVLHLSEHAAYGRIEAARAARRFPLILELLLTGALTLTAVGLLARHLTLENHVSVLQEARHKSKREVEHIVARLQPQADAPAIVRKLPTRPAALTEASLTSCVAALRESPEAESLQQPTRAIATAPRPSVIRPLAPERFKVQLTVSRDTHDKLRRAQDLLRHSIPNGDPAAVFDRALTVLLRDLERAKLAAADRPRDDSADARTRSRRIPAGIRRAVWKRDAGRCAFVGTAGRCRETGLLEFHHVVPFAAGGGTTAANLELRCRAHNQYEAELFFGHREPPPMVREARGVW